MHRSNTILSKQLVHGIVTLHVSEHVLVVKLHTPDLCCKAQYLGNEDVSANFVLNSQSSSPAEVTRMLPVILIDSSALREVFSNEIPIPRLEIELLVLH